MQNLENRNWQIDIDRLVDGELNVEAEQELLAKLDHVADGWRICALAFVEDRVLQREFAGLQLIDVAESKSKTLVSVGPANQLSSSRTSPRSTQWLSIAVGIAIAFMLGIFVPQIGSYFSKTSSPVVGGKEKPNNDSLPIVKNSNNQQPQNVEPGNENSVKPESEPLMSPMQKGIELQMVDRKGEYPTQSVKLPLVQLNKFDSSVAEALQKWNADQPLPRELVEEAEFNGQQIQKESMLMPMQMSDGTQVIVPMQRLRFQPQEVVNWQ